MKLDLKYRKLLFELDSNSRQTLSSLAKKLKTTKQVIKYRIEQLVKEEIIQGFYTIINYRKIGYETYLVYLKFENISNQEKQSFIKCLKEHKKIGVVASLFGNWEVCFTILAKDSSKFNEIYNKVVGKHKKYIQYVLITPETEAHYLPPKIFFKGKQLIYPIKLGGKVEHEKIDSKDIEILRLLAQNSRISYATLSGKTGLAANTIKYRIKTLEKKGIVGGHKVLINYEKLGFKHYRIFFHLNGIDKENDFIKFLSAYPSMISITKTIGYADAECRLHVKKPEEIEILIEKIKTKFGPLFRNHETLQYYRHYQSINFLPI